MLCRVHLSAGESVAARMSCLMCTGLAVAKMLDVHLALHGSGGQEVQRPAAVYWRSTQGAVLLCHAAAHAALPVTV